MSDASTAVAFDWGVPSLCLLGVIFGVLRPVQAAPSQSTSSCANFSCLIRMSLNALLEFGGLATGKTRNTTCGLGMTGRTCLCGALAVHLLLVMKNIDKWFRESPAPPRAPTSPG